MSLVCAHQAVVMNYVLNIPVEVQHETEWCWAAVSTMAVKSFKNVPDLAQMTQLKTVATE
jgi:hypothetical protein